MIEDTFKSFDGKELHYYLLEAENAKGVVQIVHGMQEHAGRYAHFMEFLQKNGYTSFASDLRGHGKSMDDIPGYSEGDIFKEIVKDQLEITKFLKEKYKLPVYIFGHSFGSFITQSYITNPSSLASKAVLCGSTCTKSLLYSFGKFFARLTCTFKGKKHEAKLIENMSLKGYGKKFEDGNWLSRDPENWEKYKKDEFCGQPFPANFYLSMFKNGAKNYKELGNIDVPLLIISGTSDPVSGKNAKGAEKLYRIYKDNGIDVSLILYDRARHELLNETNKDEVYKDILEFFNK